MRRSIVSFVASRALRPGGLFIFDVRLPGRGGTAVHGKVARDWAVLSIAGEDRARGTLVRAITSFRRTGRGYRRVDETHRLTLLPASELARRLRTAGFRVRIGRGFGRAPLPPGYAVIVAKRVCS